MRTAIKLEKERRKLREEREIFQKRQWDLDARELGLKQREARCAEAIELYQIREDRRGEHISASNAALLRESEDARRDLEGLKNAAIEAEERARRAEARLRMIEEDATRKRDELESLRAKARARAANDARRIEQEPEWERASLALNRETKLRELLAETFGVVGDVNRALEHGFARCGALAEGCWRASGRWRTRRRRRRRQLAERARFIIICAASLASSGRRARGSRRRGRSCTRRTGGVGGRWTGTRRRSRWSPGCRWTTVPGTTSVEAFVYNF